jgi:integrase/recombinase XerC
MWIVADPAAQTDPFPDWFTPFLNDRQTRKPSAHTMKAYRQDFIAIASLVTGGDPARMAIADITKDSMRAAFAAYAQDHEAASIRRWWSTWNVCVPSSIRASKWLRTLCSWLAARNLPNCCPRPSPAAQWKHCFRLWRKTGT